MTREGTTDVDRKRRLVTVVGPYSERRVDVARALIADGSAVALCSGPPGCSLLRGDQCPLIETSDATLMLPVQSQDRKVIAGLSLCAENSRPCIVMEPSSVGFRNGAVHVNFPEAERVANFVTSVLHHPSSRRRAGTKEA